MAQCQSIGFKIVPLEDDKTLQDLVLSVFHSTTITFTMTPAAKIIENHLNRAFIKLAMPGPMPLIPPPIKKPDAGIFEFPSPAPIKPQLP